MFVQIQYLRSNIWNALINALTFRIQICITQQMPRPWALEAKWPFMRLRVHRKICMWFWFSADASIVNLYLADGGERGEVTSTYNSLCLKLTPFRVIWHVTPLEAGLNGTVESAIKMPTLCSLGAGRCTLASWHTLASPERNKRRAALNGPENSEQRGEKKRW